MRLDEESLRKILRPGVYPELKRRGPQDDMGKRFSQDNYEDV